MNRKLYLKNPIRLLFAFFLVMVMSIFFVLLFQSASSGNVIPEYKTVVISKGDTLWNIAKQYIKENEDIRNKIYEIKELNNINSDLHIGQEIKIRVN